MRGKRRGFICGLIIISGIRRRPRQLLPLLHFKSSDAYNM